MLLIANMTSALQMVSEASSLRSHKIVTQAEYEQLLADIRRSLGLPADKPTEALVA